MLSRHYELIDTLHENAFMVVTRARRLNDGQQVIIKRVKSHETAQSHIVQMMNEAQILLQLSGAHFPTLLATHTSPHEYAHIFEDIGGFSLFHLLRQNSFSMEQKLKIALEIAQTMKLLHQKHIIHADINPKNIIYNPHTKVVQLIDYGYSILDTRLRYNSQVNIGTSGNLMYMSPEQTGRTRQKIDFRSDFYSFGMTLYHLFAGCEPFEVEEQYELIHKQIALYPTPLEERIEGFDPYVGALVRKLIDKEPMERYQSDDALIHDLKEALERLAHKKPSERFVLGSFDVPRLGFGEVFVGRHKELEHLQESARWVAQGQSTQLFVWGQAGVGKTRLIEEYMGYLQGAIIGRAKFEQEVQIHPYSAFRALFIQLKQQWIRTGMSTLPCAMDAQSIDILGRFFGELTSILPPLPPEYLSTGGGRERLPYAIGQLLACMACKERPLVLWFDDIQWSSDAAVDLMLSVFAQHAMPHVHKIVSYRPLEGNRSASRLLAGLKNAIHVQNIDLPLEALTQEEVGEMMGALFGVEVALAHALGEIVTKKTAGNALFAVIFLTHLVEHKAIYYAEGRWHFVWEQIVAFHASDNIAQMLKRELERLDAVHLAALQLLALLGSRFAVVHAHALLRQMGMATTLLEELKAQGFIDMYGAYYIFVHDEVQHSALVWLEESTKSRLHWEIGRYVESAYRKGTFEDLIAMVWHLNRAHEGGNSHKRLLAYNQEALALLVSSGSYEGALALLEWMQAHGIDEGLSKTWSFGVQKTKIYYYSGMHEEAMKQARHLLRMAHTSVERIEAFGLFNAICVTHGRGFEEVVTYAQALLGAVGVEMPHERVALERSVEALKKSLQRATLPHQRADVAKVPVMTRSKERYIIDILVPFWEAAYYLADIALMQWSFLLIVERSHRYGYTSGSAFGFVLYGGMLVSEGAYKEAYRFGEVALALTDRFGDLSMVPKVYNFMANFIAPYTKGFGHNKALYRKSLEQSKKNGDIIFGTWANFLMHLSSFFEGDPLEELREEILHENQWIYYSGDKKMVAIFTFLSQLVEAYQSGKTMSGTDEHAMLSMWESEHFYPALAWYGVLKAHSLWLQEEPQKAYELLQRTLHTDANEVVMFPAIMVHIWRAVMLLEKGSLDSEELAQLAHDQAKVAHLAQNAPALYKPYALWLEALAKRSTHTQWECAEAFDRALESARKSANAFVVSIIALSAGRFWESKGFGDMSRFYFAEAMVGLNQWGAYTQADAIKPKIDTHAPSGQSGDSSSGSLLRHEPNNYRVLLKSFYALAQSSDKKVLLERLMRTILENATASKAVMVLKEEEHFITCASIDLGTNQTKFHALELGQTPFIPYHMVMHALQTRHKVIESYPAKSGRFVYDDYIRVNTPASAMALPVLVEGEIQGVLYLENSQIPTPLDATTLQTLRLLLTQAAIVYSSIALYEKLQTSQNHLTQAQEIAKLGSWRIRASTGEATLSHQSYRIYDAPLDTVALSVSWMVAHTHPDDRAIVQASYEKLLGGQPTCETVNRIITDKGLVRTVRQRAQGFWEGGELIFSGTIQDITEQTSVQTRVDMLSHVIEQTPLAVLVTDNEGKIVYANAHTLKTTGYFLDELFGKNMRIFSSGLHPVEFYVQMWHTIAQKRQFWRGTSINRMKNGAHRDMASTIFPILDAHGAITHYVTLQDDITERNIKDKLFLMQTRQAQMGEMLSMIAHQWRQPLAIISALMGRQKIKIMMESATLEEMAQTFDEIELQVQHLSRTISDFKDFFKPDKSMVETTSAWMVAKALELIEHTLLQNNIAVETHIGIDEVYMTYESELIQVLLNLVKNGYDALKERHVAQGWIRISATQEQREVVIRVEDNGGGVDPAVIDTLFLPYVSTKSDNGTGLGLYMSKTIIQEHCQGTIEVQNSPVGAIFTIRFPMNRALQ
ncbi:MAG: hypothetical protein KU37_11625 [Sulfuricurvum sp. PC08-66]|nr:MAG: hypothetical protein KU37_11625 [Sulfuricurvum sp. PC08-66]